LNARDVGVEVGVGFVVAGGNGAEIGLVPSRVWWEMAVAVSGAVTVSRQAARSIMLLAGG